MTSYICEYCNNSYASKSSLNNHQKTTKKCLEIQKNLNKVIQSVEYRCKFCDKKLTTKQNIKNHETNCDIKKSEELKLQKEQHEKEIQKHIDKNKKLDILNKEYLAEIQKLREIIAGLQGELKTANKTAECVYEIAKQPKHITNGTNTTNTNNSNNKTLNITNHLDFKNIDKIKEIIDEKYDINHFLSGQKGCAQFAAQHLLIDDNGKYVYLCSDPSRYSFRYKNEHGEIEKDLEAKKLTNYLVDGGLKEKAKIVSLNWCQNDGVIDQDRFMIVTEKQDSILNIKDNNSEFRRELAAIVT